VLKDPRARAECSSSPTLLDFNQPVVKGSTRTIEASDLGINMARSAVRCNHCSRQLTSPLNLGDGRNQVIPAGAARHTAVRGSARRLYVPTKHGQLVPLSTIVSIQTGTDPNR